ncbi:hypothetical protein [Nocardia abscessus]|uniref:hypothetical protein n=1 Tax=Nocardia abscessus TaxID=120957 RepID=UPI002455CB9B|nr:hypothetical protein [Nocardia abscessus]
MTTRKTVQWAVLIGETVRPLPKAQNVSQAYLMADKPSYRPREGGKAVIVYRHHDREMWRRYNADTPVPTQLALFDREAS